MVGMIVLSVLGGGLFALCARQAFALENAWISLAVWAAGGGLCFWALWDRRQAGIAQEKRGSEASAAREQKSEDLANRLLEALDALTIRTEAGFTDCKTELAALGEKADALLANQPERARMDEALADAAQIKRFCQLCSQTLAALQRTADNISGETTAGFVDCKAAFSDVSEKAGALLANQPERDLLTEALESALSAASLCRALETGIGKNTAALQDAAAQWKDYNQNHRQDLEAAGEQFQYILELLARNYDLLRQVGERYT